MTETSPPTTDGRPDRSALALGAMLILGGLLLRSGVRTEIRNGTWAFLGGLGLFAIGFLFFEGMLGISGERLPIADWVLPALVIGIGVVVLGRGLLTRGEPDQT
jgi:hypothetical protein